MPRWRSSSIQSEVVARWFLRSLTAPARWIALPYSRNFSVSVVLPASGCEMIAKVRRRAISAAGDMQEGLTQRCKDPKRKNYFTTGTIARGGQRKRFTDGTGRNSLGSQKVRRLDSSHARQPSMRQKLI